ncbi:MAG: N-acetyltransferase [Candidatus Eremiobacter antarcticus]|nr:GNAT family N-acetyltransferase [Candidatus Eremiobacteraeota bacterium]MBC5807228.1 GNAT family N-acetyltransferase [Candidatus Eremiobacteraeota bacterium]PZR61916.1 MAG: N-acetyltransferase [Candidatus Eremiobacter sp. RRmetagenome_bin22]
MPVRRLEPVTLHGSIVTLEPLRLEHHDGLVEAVRDGELWKLWYTAIPTPERMRGEIKRRLDLQERGTMLPFTVVYESVIAGMTTYMNIDMPSRRVEIGSTWYRASAQRTLLNTDAKLLLLTHAFETLGCIAVEFRTSSFNRASRRAIERLGAKLDGILRSHMFHADGTLRDTCVYSIIAPEWPAVKAHLLYQLDRFGARSQVNRG